MRQSKKAPNEMVNGAWKVHLADCYGRFQLALMLLKHPPAAVDTLLGAWQDYIKSPDCQREQERARRGRWQEVRPEALEQKRREGDLKARTLRLRCLFRRMRRYWRDLDSGRIQEFPAQHKELYRKYLTGELAAEGDALTVQHGYGHLRTRPDRLGARGILRSNLP